MERWKLENITRVDDSIKYLDTANFEVISKMFRDLGYPLKGRWEPSRIEEITIGIVSKNPNIKVTAITSGYPIVPNMRIGERVPYHNDMSVVSTFGLHTQWAGKYKLASSFSVIINTEYHCINNSLEGIKEKQLKLSRGILFFLSKLKEIEHLCDQDITNVNLPYEVIIY